ncbi:NnrS family protein [Paucibacter sp. APW11]|uniref:NnrS family protein n=1 Tax=Roseateles aquae TaxID=3077235 RepID=A0ABU3P621_9BURK|nr:NnrS family protein [Paucibacter sp. APW11]MDT8998030.1 NnrS family protein [Paucibacter sp. APW11]
MAGATSLLAPHRPFFLSAAFSWTLLGGLWAWRLLQGQPWPAHGLCFTLGFMPLFIAGFALAALPRWLARPPLRPRDYLVPWGLLTLALALMLLDSGAGLIAMLLGWSWLWLRLAACLTGSERAQRRHALGVLAGMALLGAAMALALAGEPTLATRLALWGGLGTVFACALQRLTPFLHVGGRRDALWLGALLLALLLRAAALQGPAVVLVELLVAAMLLRSAFDPAGRAARRTPFVAQLLHGLLWLIASLLLAAAGWELAALHAYSLGFLCSTVLSMVSRVAAVHAGRTVVVDPALRAMHWLLQLVCLVRVLSACWPAAPAAWLPLAACGFAALGLGWLLRYGSMMLGPSR